MPTPWRRISSAECRQPVAVTADRSIRAGSGRGRFLHIAFIRTKFPGRSLIVAVLVAGLTGALAPGSLLAVTVFECLGSDGVVKFQDSPCLPGESVRKRSLADDPVPAPATSAPKPQSPARESPLDTANARSPVPAEPPSSTFLCERDDGTRYVSASGIGNRRAVPLGALGYPPTSLGQAYAGPDGIGVSAPGLRDVPVVPSRHGRGAGLYTWVEDPCVRVTGAPLCDYYAGQLEDAQRRLRFAFSDTTGQVNAEIMDWRSHLASCRR